MVLNIQGTELDMNEKKSTPVHISFQTLQKQGLEQRPPVSGRLPGPQMIDSGFYVGLTYYLNKAIFLKILCKILPSDSQSLGNRLWDWILVYETEY